MIAWWWLIVAVCAGSLIGALAVWDVARKVGATLDRADGYPAGSPEAQALIDDVAQVAVDEAGEHGLPVIELSVDEVGRYMTVRFAGRPEIALPAGGQIVSTVTVPPRQPFVKRVGPAKSVTVVTGEGGAGGGSSLGRGADGEDGQPGGRGGRGGDGGRGGRGGDGGSMPAPGEGPRSYAERLQHFPYDPECVMHWTVGSVTAYGLCTKCRTDR